MELVAQLAKNLESVSLVFTSQIIGKVGKGDRTRSVDIMPCIGKSGSERQGMAINEGSFGSCIGSERCYPMIRDPQYQNSNGYSLPRARGATSPEKRRQCQ